jgi:FMN phosphatase YigB (HAD superfamily)/DNA-binding XRE family transcriptional regulator
MLEMGEDSVGLGKAIQSARQQAGLTQQELCQQTGMSYSTLAKIERGAIKTPSVFTVQRIAAVLGLSMDGLLGAVVDAPDKLGSKKTAKNGVKFLFLDINGCLVRFFHGAFTRLAHETGMPSDMIESTFWHFNDAVCRGEMTMEEFNSELAKNFNLDSIDWSDYYLAAVEPIAEMHDLLRWAAQNYRVGLLSNIMPGLISSMINVGLLPQIKYDVIIDSSEVGCIKPEPEIYKIARDRSGVSASEILFVDDDRTNLMAAERNGWKVLWFDDYRPADSTAKVRQALEF